MDWSILLSIAGIIVSILIGIVTFYIADRRSRRRRWYQAKETILMELSKSLGEDNIPSLEIITAVIRSVLRDLNAEASDTVVIDEIIDDIIRQITSDPFLNSERRKQLQDQMLVVKNEQAIEGIHEQEITVKGEARLEPMKSALLSILFGALAAMFASLIIENSEILLGLLRGSLERAINLNLSILAAAITAFVSFFITIFTFIKARKSYA